MFRITRDDEGFAISWDASDAAAAGEVKMEFTLEGLQRGREWTTELTVLPYRNAYETLGLLIGVLERLGVTFSVSEDLSADQDAPMPSTDSSMASGTARCQSSMLLPTWRNS